MQNFFYIIIAVISGFIVGVIVQIIFIKIMDKLDKKGWL